MKITINHVHSGNVEVNWKVEPLAPNEQNNTNGEGHQGTIPNKKTNRDNFRWMLAGSLAGFGVSFIVSIVNHLVDEIGDLLNKICELPECSFLVQAVICCVIFLGCLHLAYLLGNNKTNKIEKIIKVTCGGSLIIVILIYTVLFILIKCCNC